jgi:hypothetical protein
MHDRVTLFTCRSARSGPHYLTRNATKVLDVPLNPLKCELLIHRPMVTTEMVFEIDRGPREKS